ncbi:hypothetical protein [Actinomadura rubrisoli]|nr:hypothetical protein [Actinomadura rubrisoli]
MTGLLNALDAPVPGASASSGIDVYAERTEIRWRPARRGGAWW